MSSSSPSSASRQRRIDEASSAASEEASSAKPKPFLDTVVSSLVSRTATPKPTPSSSSIHATAASSVFRDAGGEEDFEQYVASLIAREAKAAELKYAKEGLSAYIDLDRKKRLPKPNTRFLASVVRSTDDHNQSLLRQMAQDSSERLRQLESGAARRDMRLSPKKRKTSDDFNSVIPVLHRSDSNDRKRPSRGHSDQSQPFPRATTNEQTAKRSPSPAPKPSFDGSSYTPPLALPKRGRGDVGSSRLDKVFQKDYRPQLDFENYDENSMHHYVAALEQLREEQMARGLGRDEGGLEHKKRKKERKERKEKKSKKKSKVEKHKKRSKEKAGDDRNDRVTSDSASP
ncbi:hypothetical protein DFJ73DRAFT_956404 [Zopfochytrium polystomum]|nr:hypothetical protein DFJ73DRAFT_956404 [Zopfochytrium polystomum]